MERKMLAITCIVALSLAVSVSANPRYQSDTPLYTVRMEQASSEMHFLPTEVNKVTYTTNQGYTINYTIPEMGGNETPAYTWWWIWDCTYYWYYTCNWSYTCSYTCDWYYTCDWSYTCWDYTCWDYTCDWYYTCWPYC